MRSCKRTRWAKAAAACLAVLGTVVHAAAAERLDSRELLVTAGAEHGIIVQLGLGNAKQCLDLQADGRYVVQGLDRDAARVAAAREQLQAAGLQCSVSVRALSGNELPYGDNLVNLLVVDDPLGISQEEMLRVVRPLGLLIVREGDSWKRIEKPWPTELDEWTHFLRDATGNPVSHDDEVGPPRHLRWSAGPMWARSHEMNNSFPALVTAKGRMFYIFDKGVTGMEDPRLGEKWTLIARDAFNGTHLWERPLPTWGSQVWRSRALRFFGGNMARRLVADGDKLYVTFEYGGPVAILDAATGKDLGTIPGTDGAEEILAAGDQLFVVSVQQPAPKKSTTEIICYEPAVETVRWRVDVNRCVPQLTCVGDNEVIYHNRQEVVSLSRQDGSVRWQSKGEAGGPLGGPKMMLLAGDKVVVSAGKIIARSLADGSQLWEAPGPKGDSMRDSDLFVVRDAVWCSGPDGTVVGYRLDDGKPAQTVDAEAVQSYGHHLRCYRAKATDRHLITQYRGVEFLSLEDEAHCENDWIRGTCTYGVMPANGLLYVPPHSCLCYAGAMLRGLNAFAGADGVADEQAPEFNVGALEKGPAFDRTALAPPSAKAQAPEKAWPSYRHDAQRTGGTSNSIGGKETTGELARSWKTDLGTKLTPPVAADERVFVAATEKHTLHALDARTGERVWRFTADGRIDSPPSFDRGMLLFGCADGYLYCVAADDGQLAWRRRIAPAERWMAVDGQLESVWRLHGSVLVHEGLAYCCAGRSTFLDGGLYLAAVDIASGEVKHRARVSTETPTRVDREGKDFVPAYHIEGAHSDVLVAENGMIYLNQMEFSPDLKLQPTRYLTKEQVTARPSMNLDNQPFVNEDIFNVKWRDKTWSTYDELAGILVDENQSVGEHAFGRHLFTTSGFLDTTYFNRSFWMYSAVWPGFNHSNLAPKSGQLVVIGPETTYALNAYTSRYALSPKLDPETKGYLLVADANDNDPTLDPRAWGKDKGMGFSRGAPPKWHQWLPIRVQAMVLAGNTLVVCGPPDLVPPADPMAAFEGRLGSRLWTVAASDGTILGKHELEEMPTFDGMIVAEDRLFLCTQQGEVICMQGKGS